MARKRQKRKRKRTRYGSASSTFSYSLGGMTGGAGGTVKEEPLGTYLTHPIVPLDEVSSMPDLIDFQGPLPSNTEWGPFQGATPSAPEVEFGEFQGYEDPLQEYRGGYSQGFDPVKIEPKLVPFKEASQAQKDSARMNSEFYHKPDDIDLIKFE